MIETAIAEITVVLKENNLFHVAGIHESEHNPHPFTVGKKHLALSKKTEDGHLTEEILMRHPCAKKGCNRPYSMHHAKRELILQLKRDLLESRVEPELIKIKDLLMKHNIQTLSFADTEKKYKFLKK